MTWTLPGWRDNRLSSAPALMNGQMMRSSLASARTASASSLCHPSSTSRNRHAASGLALLGIRFRVTNPTARLRPRRLPAVVGYAAGFLRGLPRRGISGAQK